MRRVIVCGGRQYKDRATMFATLDGLHALTPIGQLVQGGCRGADGMAANWANSRRVPIYLIEAEWEQYGRQAGPMRNQKIAELGADLCVAFPGGRGTADMVRRATKFGIPVLSITQSPPIETPHEGKGADINADR